MSVRPGTLCKLQKGKLLDAQENFVDTFNWMVDFIDSITGDGLIKVDKSKSDKPVIKLDESQFVSGKDTNVVISKITSGDNKGKYSIDVYYK